MLKRIQWKIDIIEKKISELEDRRHTNKNYLKSKMKKATTNKRTRGPGNKLKQPNVQITEASQKRGGEQVEKIYEKWPK